MKVTAHHTELKALCWTHESEEMLSAERLVPHWHSLNGLRCSWTREAQSLNMMAVRI